MFTFVIHREKSACSYTIYASRKCTFKKRYCYNSSTNLNLPFNLSNVEQVGVIKGPGARQYGQNAFNGAVNFFTKIPESRRLDARLYGAGIINGKAAKGTGYLIPVFFGKIKKNR